MLSPRVLPVNLPKGEPHFDEVDNPGGWNSVTFYPIFEKGKYVYHAMPAEVTPVPMDNVSGKRTSRGFGFFYNGWKKNNPTRENCRFGATKDNLFSPDRQVQLGVDYLKKMGLNRKRMLDCDALFVYQLLLPIVHPSMSPTCTQLE